MKATQEQMEQFFGSLPDLPPELAGKKIRFVYRSPQPEEWTLLGGGGWGTVPFSFTHQHLIADIVSELPHCKECGNAAEMIRVGACYAVVCNTYNCWKTPRVLTAAKADELWRKLMA